MTNQTSLQQPRSRELFWLFLAVLIVALIMVAAVRWSLDHPYGTSWDEAEYLNQTMIDAQRLSHGMIWKLGGRILKGSWGRPPAYRLLALPLVTLFGAHTATMRCVSLLCFPLSTWFVYLATRRIAGATAGAFAAILFALSPEVVSASLWYSTEGPLYLATAAMMYFLFRSWTEPAEQRATWIGLGLAMGLGFLSKVSFVLLALPVLALWLFADRRKNFAAPQFPVQVKASLLAFVLAAPWWLLNIKPLISQTQNAREFVRQSLGRPSPSVWILWFVSVLKSLLGHGVSIFIGLVLLGFLWQVIRRKQLGFDPIQKLSLAACAAVGLPIMAAQLTGTNHLIRHISPAIIPLAIAVGVIAENVGWLNTAPVSAISGVLFFSQLCLLVYPAFFPNNRPVDSGLVNGRLPWRVTFHRDQWDWAPLQTIASSCGLEQPQVSYLGNAPGLSPPQIQYPWAAKGMELPEVTWLWRLEQGPPDWKTIMDSASRSDIILTLPHYVGGADDSEQFDNIHNSELEARLETDPRFQAPAHLEMGRFEAIEIVVFVKASAPCRGLGASPARP